MNKSPFVERPILFSAPMVRAILAGTKTQTRRVMNDQVEAPSIVQMCGPGLCEIVTERGVKLHGFHCPYGQPGDRLWVRETLAKQDHVWHYPADGARMLPTNEPQKFIHWARANEQRKGVPSIHMPRWASRITLEVTDVRVERLQDIRETDLQCEGLQETIDAGIDHDGTPRDAWRALWSSINGAESWAANPWVWVVQFRRLEQPR